VRIAVVGPGHPQKGGVALHTTALCRRLSAAGHDVAHVSWASSYPARLYPGALVVVGEPETAPAARTSPELRWNAPLGWRRSGDRVAAADLVVLVHVAAVQAPALLTIARRCARRGTRTVLVAHNVEAHEPRPGERALVARLVRGVDRVLVHTAQEAERARAMGARDVVHVPLAPALPDSARADDHVAPRRPHDPPLALAFGLVRPYKGIDLAIRALPHVPGLRLLVAGEFWTEPSALAAVAAAHGVADRVELRPGYVGSADLPELFGEADLAVLPYRSATGSQQAALARAFGLPVVATRVGALEIDVHDGTDGLLCPPDDVASLAAALREALEPAVHERLAAGARARAAIADDAQWHDYLESILGGAS
jgi:glycosyltransferase involved in cell wall biosynthesis